MRGSLLKNKEVWLALAAAIVIALILFASTADWLVEWFWMRHLGYENVFWKLVSIKLGWFGLAFAVVFLYFWINLLWVIRNVWRNLARGDLIPLDGKEILFKWAKLISLLISCIPALIFAEIFYAQWDNYLRFRWGGSFGLSDPILGADVGFYTFHLPFYEVIQNSLIGLTLITLLAAFVAYRVLGIMPLRWRGPRRDWTPVAHVSILFALFTFAWAWGYYLDRYELLFSTLGVVYGAGYTMDHVNQVGLWMMLFASIALGTLVLANLYIRRFKSIFIGVGGYFVLYFIVLLLLPGLIQKFKVEPSELELETPYLKHNIDFTRKAYQLDAIEIRKYPALSELTLDEISNHQETLQNIRLWDWRPLLDTYRQTQEIRLYYEFYGVDVDRYHLEDGYHQVMLSARELAPQLPEKARTWVNEHLQFTHGYGLVMNFVSKESGGGLPLYIIENIPPESHYGLTVEQPAIYYGEKMPGYRIVATGIKEFDYPRGEQNVYASYQGKGGIPLDSFWKRLLFGWYFSDINILLTSYLEPDSRIQIWRRVQERVRKIVPFLQLDQDPYLVMSKGKLYWIQDAYTVSDRFPYSEPYSKRFGRNINYIRNSVKVIVDAYQGSVSFYAMDPEDPVLHLYRMAFPGVFKELDELPEDLKLHLRYPEDLFSAQADLYRTYHMTDPQVFYNREDLWTFSKEKYAGKAISMIPYYILMRLPGEKNLVYLLMTPYTPESRDNMIAWMAAKCDFPEYGKRVVYLLPKERLIYGPVQVEAMIDQNPLISEQLSLWDQRGSRVIRGNLIVIPIDNSFLYVEPVYLTAEENNIPQLKRVIAVSGSKVVMEPSLDEALQSVFGLPQSEKKKVSVPAEIQDLSKARTDFEKVEKALQEGRWEDFGKAMEALKKLLTRTPRGGKEKR
jgi:uncharacterized membrane protein (UPF0182 family)